MVKIYFDGSELCADVSVRVWVPRGRYVTDDCVFADVCALRNRLEKLLESCIEPPEKPAKKAKKPRRKVA